MKFNFFKSLFCGHLSCTVLPKFCATYFLFGQKVVAFPLVCISVPCYGCAGGMVGPFESRTDLFFQNLDVLCCCDSTQCCEFLSEPARTQGKEAKVYNVDFLSINELNKATGLCKKSLEVIPVSTWIAR